METIYVTETSVSTDYITNAYTVTITEPAVYPSGTGEYYYSVTAPAKREANYAPAAPNIPRTRRDVRASNEDV